MTALNPDPTAVPQPLFEVVAGRPADDELAALAVALAAVAAARQREARDRASARRAPCGSRWASRSQLLRAPLTPGPGKWRTSARPR